MDSRKCVTVKYQDYYGANKIHPQQYMRGLSIVAGFTIVSASPQPMGDCWWFWIVLDNNDDESCFCTEFVSLMHWIHL